MTPNRILLVLALVLFILATLSAAGIISSSSAWLAWNTLECLGLACWVGSLLA